MSLQLVTFYFSYKTQTTYVRRTTINVNFFTFPSFGIMEQQYPINTNFFIPYILNVIYLLFFGVNIIILHTGVCTHMEN